MKINGLPVVDAKRSITLHITEGDIRKGKVKKPNACAAALACKRQLHCTEARVHIGRTYVRFNGKWHRYLTSKDLRTEIVAFDRGGTFEPGNYALLKMQPSRKYDTGRGQKTGKGKKRGRHHVLTDVRPMGLRA